jgi:hypothetical protein
MLGITISGLNGETKSDSLFGKGIFRIKRRPGKEISISYTFLSVRAAYGMIMRGQAHHHQECAAQHEGA